MGVSRHWARGMRSGENGRTLGMHVGRSYLGAHIWGGAHEVGCQAGSLAAL